jgi:hypothetical protein
MHAPRRAAPRGGGASGAARRRNAKYKIGERAAYEPRRGETKANAVRRARANARRAGACGEGRPCREHAGPCRLGWSGGTCGKGPPWVGPCGSAWAAVCVCFTAATLTRLRRSANSCKRGKPTQVDRKRRGQEQTLGRVVGRCECAYCARSREGTLEQCQRVLPRHREAMLEAGTLLEEERAPAGERANRKRGVAVLCAAAAIRGGLWHRCWHLAPSAHGQAGAGPRLVCEQAHAKEGGPPEAGQRRFESAIS